MENNILKEAIADAKSVREVALKMKPKKTCMKKLQSTR